MTDLIITNGDSAADLLRESGMAADILPWRDVLHDGPVPSTPDLESLSIIRADFLARNFQLSPEKVTADVQERDRILIDHARFDRITLWFEHDLYDQLQLLQLLSFFDQAGRLEGISLVQADDYLGLESEESIRRFESRKAPLTGEQAALAAAIFDAFRQPTPDHFAACLEQDLSALPFMTSAIRRQLEELPDDVTGLARTQLQMLAILDREPLSPRPLFAASQKNEEAMFMGDWSFWRSLEEIALTAKPLIDGLPFRFGNALEKTEKERFFNTTLTLTETGRAALLGLADHAKLNPIDRWLGGTHITTNTLWRWDSKTRTLRSPQ